MTLFLSILVISAISVINEAIDRGEPSETLRALQVQAAKLSDVEENNAVLYQMVLAAEKANKAQVSEHCDYTSKVAIFSQGCVL